MPSPRDMSCGTAPHAAQEALDSLTPIALSMARTA
jgi:hypothetical protein